MPSSDLQLRRSEARKPVLTGGLIFALAALILLCGLLQMYYIGSSGDADLLWKDNNAYLLISGESRGYHISYIEFPIRALMAYLSVPQAPEDVEPFTVIAQISDDGIRRYEEHRKLSLFTPFGQDL